MTFGFDPITAGLLSQLGGNLLSNIFSPPAAAPAGPSATQVAALLAQRQRDADASRNAWLIGLGLAAAGAVAVLVLARRK
jgi:hypothetical protein